MSKLVFALTAAACALAWAPRSLAADGADSARVTDGLVWQWSGPRSYHVQGQLRSPTFIWLRALNNTDVRVFEIAIDMVTTCAPSGEDSKKGWEIRCRIDDIGLHAVALPGDKGRLTPVLQEWDTRLTGNAVEMWWTTDGRLREVNLDGLNRRNRRDGENIEVMRQIMTRAFSGFDLRLPKGGSDKGVGAWDQKDPLVLGFLSNAGSVGTVGLTHTITGRKDDRIKVVSEGKGTVANAANTRQVAGTEQIADFFEMEMAGEAMWDLGTGSLVRRQVAASGLPTASSVQGDGQAGLAYLQAYRIDLLGDEPPPLVMESLEVDKIF